MSDDWDPVDPPTFDAADDDDAEDGDEYDPSAFNDVDDTLESATPSQPASVQPSQAPSRAVSTAPFPNDQPAKPKTVGGFIIEESDEEDAEPALTQLGNDDNSDGDSDAQPGLDILDDSQAQDISIGSMPTQDTSAGTSSATQNNSINGLAATSATVPAPVPSIITPAPVSSVATPPITTAQNGPTDVSALPSAAPTPQTSVNAAQIASAPPVGVAQQAQVVQRLPHDIVGQLEDRIQDDPKGDQDAWFSLLTHYREKEQVDKIRNTFDGFFNVFPIASSLWIEYLNYEQDNGAEARVEGILSKALVDTLNVDLWHWYINYLRRRKPLLNDTKNENWTTIFRAFEVVLTHVGTDPDAGTLWREYVEFVKSGPGNIGGSGWQDTQKVDLVRKAYHQAVSIPHDELIRLWKDYDNFELSLNKAAGRKFLAERSPFYMSAKIAKGRLDQKLSGLDRKSLPKPPPLYGCEGDAEFDRQLQKWNEWIGWEKTDPLELGTDDVASLKKRLLYVYKQACMSLRFYPEIWFEAANWCFDNDMKTEGDTFLDQGIMSNPESVLLSLKKADVVEDSLTPGDGAEAVLKNGAKLDPIYEKTHKALYAMRDTYARREARAIAEIQQHFASLPPDDADQPAVVDEDDEDDGDKPRLSNTHAGQLAEGIKNIKAAFDDQRDVLKRTISYLWVAKMRAFRRVQGQGTVKKDEPKTGFRGVFASARPRGMLTSDVYSAAALMEWHCYRNEASTKIFDRGLKLFPIDEIFAIDYIKHLVEVDDLTNAKVVFEQTLGKINAAASLSDEQKREKCRPLLLYMHTFESDYGELQQVRKLEQRLKEMFPDEGDIARFRWRHELPSFDAVKTPVVISPSQNRPKPFGMQSIQPMTNNNLMNSPQQADRILLGPHGPYVAPSPKRPLDDIEDGTPSQKFMRAESPIKGAAGRRIATTGTFVNNNGGAGSGFSTRTFIPGSMPPMQPPPMTALPRDIIYLLSILPRASSYVQVRFDPLKMIELLRAVNLPQP